MRLISIDPPILEIDYDELEAMEDPDASMAAFMDDAVQAYASWLSEDCSSGTTTEGETI